MMEKEFVTEATAKEMRDILGFDEPCISVYNDSSPWLVETGARPFKPWRNSDNERFLTAPLRQQAHRFFRERGVIIEIQPDMTSDLKWVIELTKFKPYGEAEKIDIPQEIWGYYRSYEIAEDQAFMQAIKYLKNES